jgi:hypothetical protein
VRVGAGLAEPFAAFGAVLERPGVAVELARVEVDALVLPETVVVHDALDDVAKDVLRRREVCGTRIRRTGQRHGERARTGQQHHNRADQRGELDLHPKHHGQRSFGYE